MTAKIPRWLLPAFIGVLIGWISQLILSPYITPYIKSLINKDNDSNLANSAETLLNVHSPADELRTWINRGEYARFFEKYESLRLAEDDLLINEAKSIFLDHIDELIATMRAHKAAELLKRLLEIDANDIDVQLALAETYQYQKKFDAAIKRLYSARIYAHRPGEIEKITSKIRTSVEQYDEQLNAINDEQKLLELYQMLTSIEPDHVPYFLKLAEVQVARGDYAGATQSLNTIIYDPVFGEQAVDKLQQMRESEPQISQLDKTVIPLLRTGNHYIVEATVNEVDVLRLILDTGASLTSIKPQILINLGIDPWSSRDVRKLSTANGIVDAPVIVLPSLAVGDQAIVNIEIAAINFTEKPDIDGLLGMNFLQNYKFFIDQSKDVLELSPQS